MSVDGAKQRAVVKQKWNGCHLHCSFDLAQHVHGHAFGRPDHCHPFAQGRNGDFAANDDQGHKHVGPLQVHQHQQRGTHQKFVSHRIEKSAKR